MPLEPKQSSCGTNSHDKLSSQQKGTDKSKSFRQAGRPTIHSHSKAVPGESPLCSSYLG